MLDRLQRIVAVTGHYGCGKTNFSINLALDAKDSGEDVTIIDLDIVNPYFRTADFVSMFGEHDIKTVNPNFANSALDVPSLPRGISAAIASPGRVIIDLGGDDVGARALGRYKGDIERAGGMDMLYLFSVYRPFTSSPAEIKAHIGEIEGATRARVTGLVNSTNLGAGTTLEDVRSSLAFADEVAAATGLPLLATLALQPFSQQIPGAYPVKLFVRLPWDQRE